MEYGAVFIFQRVSVVITLFSLHRNFEESSIEADFLRLSRGDAAWRMIKCERRPSKQHETIYFKHDEAQE